jgi:hypothetical protein
MAPARHAASPTAFGNDDIRAGSASRLAQNFLMRPMRLMIKKAATEDKTNNSAAHRNPDSLSVKGNPLVFICR